MRRVYYLIHDTVASLLGRPDPLTPSEEKIAFIGGGDFKIIGEEFRRYFLELGGLKPQEKVLDVGCGIGRMAVPLTKYLKGQGGYEGFDIYKPGIDWCREKITPRYPNFRFQLADAYSKHYNPEGKQPASAYRFPYPQESFDFVFLTSVFTHMLPADVENYFSEIVRTLKSGGRCLITFFLLNQESLPLIKEQKSSLDFPYDFGYYRLMDANIPEAVVGYDEAGVLDWFEKYGLSIKPPIHYGSWCGRTNFLSYQDIIVAAKG